MIRSNLFPVLVFFAASLMSCSFFSQGTKIEFVLAQTPKFELNEIDALEVGQFKGQPLVKISLPVEAEGPPDLSPDVLSFEADQSSEQVAELFRLQVLKNFSKKSSLKLLNTSEDAKGYPVVIPDPNRVAVISALVRYSQIKQESKEPVPYFLTVFNEALPIEQQLLARDAVFGAERLGGGIEENTPYVELIGDKKFSAINKFYRKILLNIKKDGLKFKCTFG